MEPLSSKTAITPTTSELSFIIRDIGLGMTLLESFANGIYTAIFAFTLWLLFSRERSRHYNGHRYMLAIIIVLYALSVLHLACRWDMVRRAFVIDGATANTVLQSFLHQPTWSTILSSLSLALMTLIADCVLIWRCWVVWDRDWRAPILPLVTTITGTIFCAFSLAYQIAPQAPGRLSTSNRTKFTEPGIIYFCLSLMSTVFSTCLIIYRIISVSRRTLTMNRYKGVIKIITESAAIYALTLIIFIPFFAQKDFKQGYSQAVLVPITGVAPTIITVRVSLGLAQETSDKTSTSPSLVSWDGVSPSPPIIEVGHRVGF